MLAFAAMANVTLSMHARCLVLASILTITPFLISFMLMTFLPMDLWFVLIISNCLLTSVRTISTTILYFLHIAENKSESPWERFDDLIFSCRILTHFAELLLALFVVFYGIYTSFVLGKWTVFSFLVLFIHSYFNVWRKLKTCINAIRTRDAASKKINEFEKPTKEQLLKKSDVCMICLGEMSKDARVTTCNHYFHGFCLKKWLFIKPVCPLCYVSLGDGKLLVEQQEYQSIFRRRRQEQRNYGDNEGVNLENNVHEPLLGILPDNNGGVDLENMENHETGTHRLRIISSFSDWSSDSDSSRSSQTSTDEASSG